jgi:hypothetical protein
MFQTIQTNFGYQSLAQAAEIQLGKNKNYSFRNIAPLHLYIKNTVMRFLIPSIEEAMRVFKEYAVNLKHGRPKTTTELRLNEVLLNKFSFFLPQTLRNELTCAQCYIGHCIQCIYLHGCEYLIQM